jgi:hypothetical protein
VSIPGRGNSSKRPDGNPSGQVVSFTRGAADRIAKVVRTVERGDTSAEGLRFTRNMSPPAAVSVRPATFTGEWKVDTLRTVTFQNVTTTPNTAQVANLTFNLTPFGTATSYTCLIAKVTGPNTVSTSEGTASWALIAAEEPPSTFRVATFTGEWTVETPKQVTLKNQTTTPNTLSAVNLIAKIPVGCVSGTATRDVLVTQAGTAWYYVTHERECDGQYPAAELDEGADCDSSLGLISQGDGPQVLLNEQGCAKWWELYKQEVVTDVQWSDGIVVKKRFVWAFRDPGEQTEETIISATDCEEN